MKRILAMVLLLVMLSSLAACGNSKESSNDSNPQSFKDTVTPNITIETDTTDDETNNAPPTDGDNGVNGEDGNDSSNVEQHTHTYQKDVISPTCEEDGFTRYSCDCGSQYTEDYIIANGHSYGTWVETKAATETTVGKEKRQCKNCEKTESRDIPKIIKGHTHEFTLSSTQSPSCQMDLFRTYSCYCGMTYTEPIPKIPHTYTTKTVEPTCTAYGYTEYTCTACGYSYSINDSKPQHNYTDTVTKPTCTKAGYTTHTCKTCGSTYTDAKKNALGHSWGGWITVTAAEVGKTGTEIRICSVCNESQTQTIPALKEDTTKKWFINQYNIAKQQYLNSLDLSKTSKQKEITDLQAKIDYELDKYIDEKLDILNKYPPSATRDVMLTNAQQNYAATIKPYKDRKSRLTSEIAEIEAEIANPNVDSILTIVTQNSNMSSITIYDYYHKYSDSIA